jgi:hypothetical protein
LTTLDEKKLDSLLEAVKLAKQFGFNSSSSPVEFLLEAGIDLMLLLAKHLKVPSKGIKQNPIILFKDDEQDSLGNPKQITINKRSKSISDPSAADICKKLASWFVMIKNQDPHRNSFMESLFRTRILKAPEISVAKQTSKKVPFEKKISRQAYYRRLRRRRCNKN